MQNFREWWVGVKESYKQVAMQLYCIGSLAVQASQKEQWWRDARKPSKFKIQRLPAKGKMWGSNLYWFNETPA